MPRILKYLIPVLLLAGVILGGASLSNAHSLNETSYSHKHKQPSKGACAYGCVLKGHGQSRYSACGDCICRH